MDLDRQAPRITAACLSVLTAVALGATLYWLRPVLVPFVLALFLSIVAEPAVTAQIRGLRMPRGLAVVTTLLLGIAVILVISAVVAAAIAQLREGMPTYDIQLHALQDRFNAFLERLGLPHAEWTIGADQLQTLLAALLGEVTSLVSQGAIVLVFLFFLLSTHTEPPILVSGTWTKIRRSIAHYLSIKVAVSLLTAVLVGTILFFLGVPLALAFAFLVFVLNFVPNVGSVVATVLPLPVLLGAESISTTTVVLALTLPAVVQFTIGQLLEPRLLGRSLDLHPVVVALGLVFWGMFWGLVGVLLAVPMTSAIKIVLVELGYTKPVADLLSERRGDNSGGISDE
ncbi:MAG: AI-2E family transporter [Planctomycetota bacterium]